MAAYTYGRMVNPADYLMSDALTLGAGALLRAWPEQDLRFTGLFVALYNLQDIRYRDPYTGAWATSWGSHGWLFYFTLDASIRLWEWIHLEAGVVLPVGKTLEDSPNDMDYLVKGGLLLRF
jgi:hypothetical protein